MGGTIEGGRKARETNLRIYGPDFYRKIGSKGGRISRRGPAGTKKEKEFIWRPGDAMFSK